MGSPISQLERIRPEAFRNQLPQTISPRAGPMDIAAMSLTSFEVLAMTVPALVVGGWLLQWTWQTIVLPKCIERSMPTLASGSL